MFDAHGKVDRHHRARRQAGVRRQRPGTVRVFVNIEDTSEIAAIDVKTNTVKTRWKLAPCESPSGLAIDRKHHRLFTVCENEIMAVVDSTNGHVVHDRADRQRPPMRPTFDDEKQLAFASNGQSATLTVVP